MRSVRIAIAVVAVAACRHDAATPSDAAIASDAAMTSDAACNSFALGGSDVPVYCRMNGLVGFDATGMWQLSGTSSYSYEGSNTTTPLDTPVMIQIAGCSTAMTFGSASPMTGDVSETGLTFSCQGPGACASGYSLRWVCVRDTDGALVYFESSDGQMIGQPWTESTTGVLAR